MSIVSHVNIRTCTGERAQQHAQRRTSSCITTCHLNAYLVPIFGNWPHSRTIWQLILREVAKGSMPFGPYSTKVFRLITSSTESPEPVARTLQVSTGPYLSRYMETFIQFIPCTVNHGNLLVVCVAECRCLTKNASKYILAAQPLAAYSCHNRRFEVFS